MSAHLPVPASTKPRRWRPSNLPEVGAHQQGDGGAECCNDGQGLLWWWSALP